MILPDVNVLIYAYADEIPGQTRYREWLHDSLQGPEPMGLSDLVLSAVVRIATSVRILQPPATPRAALDFVESLRSSPATVRVAPGPRHWEIFTGLVERAGCRGGLVSDAFHAALAIEHGCEWITTDRDYARFPGLRWRHPLDA